MIDKQRYRAVIASRRWRDLRGRLIRERGVQCERCKKTWAPGYRPSLELHHLTYERLGCELDQDVQLVCDACHGGADEQRASQARARATDALWSARLDGWARKKYGDEWHYDYPVDEMWDRFAAWLEQQGDDE